MLHIAAKYTKNKDHLKHLYKTFVRSTLEFSSTVWRKTVTKICGSCFLQFYHAFPYTQTPKIQKWCYFCSRTNGSPNKTVFSVLILKCPDMHIKMIRMKQQFQKSNFGPILVRFWTNFGQFWYIMVLFWLFLDNFDQLLSSVSQFLTINFKK